MPAVSCQQKFRRLRLGIEAEGFLTPCVQQELNGFLGLRDSPLSRPFFSYFKMVKFWACP